MKVIIAGAGGQVGWELQRTVPDRVDLIALQREELDITDTEQVNRIISSENPDWVINAAAYTAVDKAEEEVNLAFRINRDGPANISKACKQAGSKMLQISTDFIFDGSQNRPYHTSSTPNPLGIYGASKQAGDEAALKELGDNCAIVRTSWVYSSHGKNFVKTMLKLMSEMSALKVIADQTGTPTWANGLAHAIWIIVSKNIKGIQHWSDYGIASWYDFAVAIYEIGISIHLINNECVIKPIRTDQYPVLATRPQYSVLDKSETVSALENEPQHWRQELRKMLIEVLKEQ